MKASRRWMDAGTLSLSNTTGSPSNGRGAGGSRAAGVPLESTGEVYPLTPGQERVVKYVGDSAPTLSTEAGGGELKLWEEGQASSSSTRDGRSSRER